MMGANERGDAPRPASAGRPDRLEMNGLWTSPVALFLFALFLAAVFTPAFRSAARRWGLLDRPNVRSSHQSLVPRGGGAAIVVSVLAALWLVHSAWAGRTGTVAVLSGGLALAAIGLWDDRYGLSPVSRFVAQLAVAAAVVSGLGGPDRFPLPPPLDLPLGPLARPLAVLWIVAVVNFFNFLDGIDGLAALQAAVTSGGIVIAVWDPFAVLLAAALAGAAAGFLPFNWAPASVFLGDVGSYFLGFTLAALPLTAPPDVRARAVFFVSLSLWLFLADATWTLARRALRGERVHEAHREHLYQKLARRFGHARVTLSIGIASAALTAAALGAWWSASPTIWAWAALGLAVAFFATESVAATTARAA